MKKEQEIRSRGADKKHVLKDDEITLQDKL